MRIIKISKEKYSKRFKQAEQKKVQKAALDAKQEIQRKKKLKRFRLKQERVKYMKHKEIMAKLEAEGLKEDYLLRKNQQDLLLCKEEKMAIDTIFAMSLKEPVYTPQDLADKISDYFKKVDKELSEIVSNSGKIIELKKRKPYTIEGLCNYLCITKKTFDKYCSDESMKEYHYVAQTAQQIIIQKVLEGALNKEYDSQLSKFYLKNVSDLNEEKKSGPTGKVSNVVFVTVGNREELKELEEGHNGFNGEIIDAETIED